MPSFPGLFLEWKDKKSGTTMRLRFDAVTTETHESMSSITKHPVEEGSDVVDNSRPEPKKISLEGYVSNKPIQSNPDVEKYLSYAPVTYYLDSPPRGSRPARVKLDIPKPPIALNVASLVTAGAGALLNAIAGNPGTFATLAKEPPAPNPKIRPFVLSSQNGDVPNRAQAMYEQLIDLQEGAILMSVTTALGEIDNMLIEKVSVPRTVDTGNGAMFQVDLVQVRIVASQTVDAPTLPAEARGAQQVSKGFQAIEHADAAKAQARNDSLAFDFKEEVKKYVVDALRSGALSE